MSGRYSRWFSRMESVLRRAYDRLCAIPPRIALAAKLGFAALAIVIVATIVDWPRVFTDLDRLFLPILAGIGLLIPVLMVTALRWKLLMGTETPRPFSFLTAFRGWGLGLFCNLILPGLVGGDVGASPLRQRSRPHKVCAVVSRRPHRAAVWAAQHLPPRRYRLGVE